MPGPIFMQVISHIWMVNWAVKREGQKELGIACHSSRVLSELEMIVPVIAKGWISLPPTLCLVVFGTRGWFFIPVL